MEFYFQKYHSDYFNIQYLMITTLSSKYFIIEIIFHRESDVIQYGGYITKIL